jgi:hypothetical protein
MRLKPTFKDAAACIQALWNSKLNVDMVGLQTAPSPAQEEEEARHASWGERHGGDLIADVKSARRKIRGGAGGKIGLNILHALGKAAVAGIQDGSVRLTSVIDGTDPHKDAVYGGKIGINILHALGKAAVAGIQDGSVRLTSAIDGSDPHKGAVYGGKIGINILKALGNATETAIEDGSTRLTSAIDGSDPHGDAEYGGEGFPKGSKKAIAAMKRARKAQTETAHFKKGSDAAMKKMEELREMRGTKGGAIRGPNPWLEHVKAFRGRHPELTYKECLSAAAAEYRR